MLIIGHSLTQRQGDWARIDGCRAARTLLQTAMWKLAQVWFGISQKVPRLSSSSLRHQQRRNISHTAPMGAAGQHTVPTTERLTRLRELMRAKDIAVGAVVVPSEDQRV